MSDLTPETVRAAEAAALRRAADVVAHFYSKGQVTKPEDLLALISPEAQTALDRMLAEAEARGMERAAEIATQRKGSGWEDAPAAHPYDRGYIAACHAIASAIRAQKE